MATTEYDYRNQAWVIDGRYVRCGHVDECACYGRTHEGERAPSATGCANCAERPAVALAGGEPVCAPCLIAAYDYARLHEPESIATWEQFRADAEDDFAAFVPPCPECVRSYGPNYSGPCEH